MLSHLPEKLSIETITEKTNPKIKALVLVFSTNKKPLSFSLVKNYGLFFYFLFKKLNIFLKTS